jgi:uncharacterized protein (DUF697 family)
MAEEFASSPVKEKTANRLAGKFNVLKKATDDQIQKWSSELLLLLKNEISKEAGCVEEYVNNLKRLNSGLDPRQLAQKIISRRSLKAFGVGAVCGVGGLLTMPITMPSDLYLTFRLQARMVLSIAHLFGWNIKDEDTITDVLLVMGGNAGGSAIKNFGIGIGQEYTKKAVQKHITRDVMKKINKIISRKIISKAGEKSLTSFAKLVPLVGAPIGGAFDYASTQAVGKTALKFYSG